MRPGTGPGRHVCIGTITGKHIRTSNFTQELDKKNDGYGINTV